MRVARHSLRDSEGRSGICYYIGRLGVDMMLDSVSQHCRVILPWYGEHRGRGGIGRSLSVMAAEFEPGGRCYQ